MFSVGLGQSLVFTSIPILAREQGLNEIEVSLIFSLSAFAWFFTSPLWGRYSDILGNRVVGIIGSLGYSANMILIILPLYLLEQGLLASWALLPSLIACRMVYGIFGSATRPALFGYAGKISSPENRATVFSNLESGFILGTVLGPIIGAFFFRFLNTELPFILFGLMGMISALQINVRLRNTDDTKISQEKPKRLSIKNEAVWPFFLISSMISVTQAILFQTLGFFIFDRLGYNSTDAAVYVSVCFAILSVSMVMTQTFVNPLFKSVKLMMVLGPFLVMVSFLTLILSDDIFALIGTLMLNGIGYGVTRPAYSTSLSLSHDKSYQSSAAGILGSTLPIGHMVAPLFVSLYLLGYEYIYSLSAIICLIVIGFTLIHPYILRSNAYK